MMLAKIISAILARRHLINLENSKANVNQFGHIGCQETLHELHSALILIKQHGLAMYALLLVNLLKAFNTVKHSLLLLLLAKYRIPTTMI